MRNEGYYWVKWFDTTLIEIAKWNGVFWYFTGDEVGYESDKIEVVNENEIILPNDPRAKV